MDAKDAQRLNDLEFKVQGMAQKIQDLERLVTEMSSTNRDTSESPRPQRSTQKFAGSSRH